MFNRKKVFNGAGFSVMIMKGWKCSPRSTSSFISFWIKGLGIINIEIKSNYDILNKKQKIFIEDIESKEKAVGGWFKSTGLVRYSMNRMKLDNEDALVIVDDFPPENYDQKIISASTHQTHLERPIEMWKRTIVPYASRIYSINGISNAFLYKRFEQVYDEFLITWKWT